MQKVTAVCTQDGGGAHQRWRRGIGGKVEGHTEVLEGYRRAGGGGSNGVEE